MDAENTKDSIERPIGGKIIISDADLAAAGVSTKLRDESWSLTPPQKTPDDNYAPSKDVLPPFDNNHSIIQDVAKKHAITFYSFDSSEIGFRFGGHDPAPHDDNNSSNKVKQSHPAGLYFKVNF